MSIVRVRQRCRQNSRAMPTIRALSELPAGVALVRRRRYAVRLKRFAIRRRVFRCRQSLLGGSFCPYHFDQSRQCAHCRERRNWRDQATADHRTRVQLLVTSTRWSLNISLCVYRSLFNRDLDRRFVVGSFCRFIDRRFYRGFNVRVGCRFLGRCGDSRFIGCFF